MYIAGIGQALLGLLSFKVGSGNHQRGISLLQKFSDIFGNMRLRPLKMTSHLTSHNFQILKLRYFLSYVSYEFVTRRSDRKAKRLSRYENYIVISVAMTT